MKRFIFVLFAITLLFSGCSQNASNGNGTEATAVTEEPGTNASASKTLSGEIKFYPTFDENYKTAHNEMFDFWFDIPVSWSAIDKTEDGSAYNILTGNDKVEISIHGILITEENEDEERFYASLAGKNGTVSEFMFRDGWIGTQIIISDTEEYYLRVDGDSYLGIYINADKDPGWKAENHERLMYFVQSARTTKESYGKYFDEENTITPEELQLGNISTGITYDELLKAMGQDPEEEAVDEYDGIVAKTLFFADGTQVFVVDNIVHTINVTSPEYETPKGLKTGDSEQRLLELYGEPSSKEDGVWGYNYNGYEIFTVVVEDGIVTQIQIDYGADEITIY